MYPQISPAYIEIAFPMHEQRARYCFKNPIQEQRARYYFKNGKDVQVRHERKTTKQPIKNYKKLSQKKPDAQRSDCTPRAKITKGTTARSLKGCQRWDNRNHTKIAKSTTAESTRRYQRHDGGQSALTWRKCSDGHMSIGDLVCDFVQTDRAKALRLSRRAFVIYN